MDEGLNVQVRRAEKYRVYFAGGKVFMTNLVDGTRIVCEGIPIGE